MIANWIEGGMAKGNNPNVLPKEPKFEKSAPFKKPKEGVIVSGDFVLQRPLMLEGLLPQKIADGTSIEMVAVLPDGATQPLVWLSDYKSMYQHPFLFRDPLALPAGTIIRGVPSDAEIILITGKKIPQRGN